MRIYDNIEACIISSGQACSPLVNIDNEKLTITGRYGDCTGKMTVVVCKNILDI